MSYTEFRGESQSTTKKNSLRNSALALCLSVKPLLSGPPARIDSSVGFLRWPELFAIQRVERTMRSNSFECLGAVAVLALCAFQTSIAQQSSSVQLANGFYAVLQAHSSRDAVPVSGPGHTTIMYDGRYGGSIRAESPEYITIGTTSFVPLVLESSPVAKKDGTGWTSPSVTLSRKYIHTLEDFTKTHPGGRVAILLGGEINSMHKIRSVISEGKVQITGCHDKACDILLSRLTQEPSSAGPNA
jgi:hypothetical protein